MIFSDYLNLTGEIGFVEKIFASLVYVQGLPGAHAEETIVFETGDIGKVIGLTESSVEVLMFTKPSMKTGARAARTGRLFEIPVGDELLGSIIDPMGRSLNPLKPLPPMKETRPVEIEPPGINERTRIVRRCETGVTMIDLLIPLGKGQRELIIGDQKTGKTLILLRALYSQVKAGSVGIYAAIGKSQLSIKQVELKLEHLGIRDQVIMIAASGDAAAGILYLAPYAAMTIAEYFRDKGQDVFLVLDDLSMHAKAYREIALLGRRFPGRNSYPGDIFFVHSRILERAGNFRTLGGKEVSITCLPVAEAVLGSLSGYIQTNLMSMTDGHIFFDHDLFAEGRRPAIDPFLSVSRVGRQTQKPLQKEIARELLSFLKNIERMRTFQTFGAELSESIKRAIEKEQRVVQFLDQTAFDHIPSSVQILLFGFAWSDIWQEKTRSEIRFTIQKIVFLYETKPEIAKRIEDFVEGCDSLDSLMKRMNDFSNVIEMK